MFKSLKQFENNNSKLNNYNVKYILSRYDFIVHISSKIYKIFE